MKEVLLLLFGDEFREYFSLTARQKFYVWYFCLSLCFLCITDDSPIWAIIVVVLNFANATYQGLRGSENQRLYQTEKLLLALRHADRNRSDRLDLFL